MSILALKGRHQTNIFVLPSSAKPSKASASASAEFSLNLKLLHTPPHPTPKKVVIQQEVNSAGLARKAGPELGTSQPQLVLQYYENLW